MIGLTRELAKQWASKQIRVNAIAPGYFRSELTEEMFAAEDAPGLRHIQRNTLMRRAGEVDEFDGALTLPASDVGATSPARPSSSTAAGPPASENDAVVEPDA